MATSADHHEWDEEDYEDNEVTATADQAVLPRHHPMGDAEEYEDTHRMNDARGILGRGTVPTTLSIRDQWRQGHFRLADAVKANHNSSEDISLIREGDSKEIRLIREGAIARDEEAGLIGEGDMATPN